LGDVPGRRRPDRTTGNDPVWSESVATARAWNEEIDTGKSYIVFTNGLLLLAIVTLAVGWKTPRPGCWWLRSATALFIIAVASTLAYVLPELQEIWGASAESTPDDALSDRIERWTLLDTLRELLNFAGFIIIVRAVGLSHAAQARAEGFGGQRQYG
jgi:hypothetical protein